MSSTFVYYHGGAAYCQKVSVFHPEIFAYFVVKRTDWTFYLERHFSYTESNYTRLADYLYAYGTYSVYDAEFYHP